MFKICYKTFLVMTIDLGVLNGWLLNWRLLKVKPSPIIAIISEFKACFTMSMHY